MSKFFKLMLAGACIILIPCSVYASISKIPSSEIKKIQKEEGNNMTMDDFLLDGETVVDHSDIASFLDEMKITLVDKDEESSDSDNEAGEADEVSDDNTETKSKILIKDYKTEIITPEKTDEDGHIEVDTSDWHLVLVNKQNPIPEDYEINLVSINKSMQADARIINDLKAMFSAAERDDINLWICSAYRSFERQTALFDKKIKKLTANGMNYLDAYTVASKSVTVPGTSEHQLGLALDIVTSGYTNLDEGFGETKAGKWLIDNAYKYGFILRYPKGKENVTGIIYEPWHYRYVGRKYSKQINDLGITLEEFVSGDY